MTECGSEELRAVRGCDTAPYGTTQKHKAALEHANDCDTCLCLLIESVRQSERKQCQSIIEKMRKALWRITMYVGEGSPSLCERMRVTAADALNELRDFQEFDAVPTSDCKHCGGDIAVRNPKGFCDHLRYPDYCDVCRQSAAAPKSDTAKPIEVPMTTDPLEEPRP